MASKLSGVAACTLCLAVSWAWAASLTDQPLQGAAQAAAPDEKITVIGRKRNLFKKKTEIMEQARDKNLLPKFGATSYSLDRKAIETLPQGENTPIDKLVLQAPGVSYDSAISNPDFHVRNEYANTQYRINGIELPDGVSALGPVLQTNFISNLNLLDGALPAQYGLRTAGVIDLTTKTGFTNGGLLDIFGGTQRTFAPSVQYGGTAGQTSYFLSGRFLTSDEGLESATPGPNPIHDQTTQEKFFGYGSTILDDNSRLTYMAGGFVGQFQIPNVIGQTPLGDYGSPTLTSTQLNENEHDNFFFGLVALQTHTDVIDTQFSLFSRYAGINFIPDLYGDLAFNDVASRVTRESLLNGFQFDGSYRLSDAHTLRAGLIFSAEHTNVGDDSTVLPLNPAGNPLPTPITIDDATSKMGYTVGAYAQDEWRLTRELTLNTGLRFDQIFQFVTANQLSPRVALVYKPAEGTDIHIGVSRYFTPPMQAQATPARITLFNNTTQQQSILQESPVRPERATYLDAGIEQRVLSRVNLGVDLYMKRSHNTLDDGQFGQAVVLTQYNYAEGFSHGAEFKASYAYDGFRIYGNFSAEITKVKGVTSNQYLIGDPVELAFVDNNYSYASDAQTYSASFGTSYNFRGILISVDGIYGSGLRAGFANELHSPPYTQWNGSISRNFDVWNDRKPVTLRLSLVNLFDTTYILRSATGIGEFAPQYGPRREIFGELSQAF